MIRKMKYVMSPYHHDKKHVILKQTALTLATTQLISAWGEVWIKKSNTLASLSK